MISNFIVEQKVKCYHCFNCEVVKGILNPERTKKKWCKKSCFRMQKSLVEWAPALLLDYYSLKFLKKLRKCSQEDEILWQQKMEISEISLFPLCDHRPLHRLQSYYIQYTYIHNIHYIIMKFTAKLP